MKDGRLFLKYTLAGDSQLHVEAGYRIVIDGRGGLLVHRLESGTPHRIPLSDLETFSIHTVAAPKRRSAAAAA